MRIVYVAWHGSVHTRRWVSFFAQRGHDVHVVTCGDAGNDDPEAQRRPYAVHDLGAPRFGKLGYVFKLLRARRTIRALQPEIVHAHYATSYGLLALAAGCEPLVVTAHGDDVLISPRNRVMRAIVTRVLRAARLVTVPSDHMRDAVEQLVGDDPRRDIAVFQYGVETRRLATVAAECAPRRSGAWPDRPLRLVSARAMLRLYRLDALIDAISLLRDRDIDVSCDLVGDGPERAALESQVRDLGLQEHVVFHGHQPADETERLIASADIYVSVSESDGVSLALLEAMALGAVPVLSDIPANRSWINDGATGVLVDFDPAGIAAGIERAAALDRARVAGDNQAVVAERGDRETNLAACELLIDALVGVVFERDGTAAGSDGEPHAA